MTLASFIELIAKIKQKNNGTFKLVDAQDVECEDGKGLDEVLNEKLDKNQGVENVGKTMVVGDDGNVTPVEMSAGVKDYNDLENKPQINGVELKGNKTSSDLKMYTKEEVDYMLADKMDKPYVPIEITDNTTITDALEGNFKIDKIKGNTYQNVETDIKPTPERPVPINSRKVKANGEYVELRSLKETGNLFDINFIKLWGNYSDGMTILNDGTVKTTNNDATLWPLKTKSITIPKSANYTIKYDFETISGGANSGWISLVNMSNDNPKIFSTSGKTLYLDAGDYYVRFYRGQGATDVENNIVQYSNIVLVEGTSAPSTYVAPTVRDYKIVDHVNKTSKIVRNIGIANLTNLTWTYGDRDLNHIRCYAKPSTPLKFVEQYCYCNVFENIYSSKYDYSKEAIYLGNNMGDKTISIMANQDVFAGQTQEQFDRLLKEYINNPNAITLYALETPTEETIAYVETDTSEVGYSWQDTTSPSPDIKSEVKPVEKIDILKTGKNLLDIDKVIDGERLKNNDNGTLTATTTDTDSSASSGQKLSDIANLIVGKTYTLNAKTTGTQKYIYLEKSEIIWLFGNSRKITQDDLDSTVYFYASGTNSQAIISEIQIEPGETATAYEPYTEQRVNITLPQPLYENDIVNVESGNYEYEERKYIVTGDEKFYQDHQSQAGYYGRYFNLENGNGVLTEKIWCNYLSYIESVWNLVSEGCCQNSRTQIHLKFSNDRLGITDNTPVEEKRLAFANYLKQLYASEEPLYVVGKVAKTTQPIPEEDLTKLKSLKTNAGVNNIFVGGEVKPTIEARYPRDLALVQQQLEQKVLLMSETLTETRAKLLLQGGND